MPRPRKCCRVAFLPGVTFFKPAGIPLKLLEEVNLTVDEAEALRLKDIEGLEQAPGAARMNVSRPTFQRILASARGKIADAILNGKAIRIEGGHYETAPCRFRCTRGHEWELPGEDAAKAPPRICPVCQTEDIVPVATPVQCRKQVRDGRRCCERPAENQTDDTGEVSSQNA
jgi:uncharacterized protein